MVSRDLCRAIFLILVLGLDLPSRLGSDLVLAKPHLHVLVLDLDLFTKML